MNRSAFAPAVALLLSSAVATSAFAQAKPAAPTTQAQAPAVRAKFATPLKGEAPLQVIQTPSKFVGKEIVTVYKVKNMANAPIALLRLDEYWYDKGGKNMVSADTYRHRQPFQPGEVIEITTRAPAHKEAARSQAQFTHANGKVTVKAVKKFE